MRPKVVSAILLIAAAGLLSLWRYHAGGNPARLKQSDATAAALAPATVPPASPKRAHPPFLRPADAPAQPSTPAGSADYPGWVQAAQTRLLELAANDDAASLQGILTELTSPEPVIRASALAAARQFGSRAAIPYLEEVAGRTDDAREKVSILDAVNFLQAPSLTELREAGAARAATNGR